MAALDRAEPTFILKSSLCSLIPMSAIAFWKNLEGLSTSTNCRFPGKVPWAEAEAEPQRTRAHVLWPVSNPCPHSDPGEGGFHRAPLVLPPVYDDDEADAGSVQAAETGFQGHPVFLVGVTRKWPESEPERERT